jgi:hypothetical protein
MNNFEQQPADELQPFLQSIKGMQRAKAPEGIFVRAMADMKRPVARIVPMSRLSLVAACLVALIGLNIAVLAIKSANSRNNISPAVEYYGTSAEYGYSY